MASNCAPATKFDKFTCFPRKALVAMTAEINRTTRQSLPLSASKKRLWDNLQSTFAEMCGANEACWPVDQQYLKPPAPDRSEKYLMSSEIRSVLAQYSNDDFWFLGVYPKNFDEHELGKCIGDMLCSMNIKLMSCSSFAFVINTHKSGMPGEHWIAMFCGMDPKKPNYGVYFYDSYGGIWPRSVGAYMERLTDQMADPLFKRHHNTFLHQREMGECGMFCIEWIVAMAEGIPFDAYVSSKAVTDRYVTDQRAVRFRQ
jgi:hypothetical protein